MLLRGDLTTSDVARGLARLRPSLHVIHWNPDPFKVGLCATPPVGQPHAALALSNSCCYADVVRTMLARFERLYSRRAHLHHFTQYVEQARPHARATAAAAAYTIRPAAPL